MEKAQVIEFVRDWNNGVTVEDLASKFNIAPATVRQKATFFRKKGIKVATRGRARLTESDVEEINSYL